MSTKKILIIIIAILLSGLAKAQIHIDANDADVNQSLLQNFYIDYVASNIGTETVMTYDKIEGDPYLYKDFEDGTIKFEKDKNIVGKLRYNMYSDEIEFIYRDYRFILIYEESFSGIKIGEYDFVQLPDPNKTDNAPGYFIYLKKGKYNLLVKKSVKFLKQEEPKIYVESKPGRFEKNADKFYLLNENNELYEIRSVNKLKKFSDDFNSYTKEYTAENKLRINSESLTSFFTWLNAK